MCKKLKDEVFLVTNDLLHHFFDSDSLKLTATTTVDEKENRPAYTGLQLPNQSKTVKSKLNLPAFVNNNQRFS